MSFSCNKCWKSLGSADVAYSTTCKHLFCAECAQATLQAGACCCCEAALQKQSFSSTKLDASPTKAMRLLMAQEPETVMQTASAAIEFLSYQKSLGVAKRRKTDKAKVKNILDQSRKRIVELHDGYKKVREKCQAVMIAKAEIQAQKTALEEHCNKKAEASKQFKAAIARVKATLDTNLEIRSTVGSDLSKPGSTLPWDVPPLRESLAKRGAGPAGQGAQPSQGAQQGTRYQSRGRSAQAHGGRPSNGRAASAGGHKEMPAAAGLPKHQSLQQLLQSSPAPAAKHQRRSSQSSLTHTREQTAPSGAVARHAPTFQQFAMPPR